MILGVLYAAHSTTAGADPTRSQIIPLQAGWNAVWLDVYPTDSAPEAVFGELPVDIVATHYPTPVVGQFVADSSVDLAADKGWLVWYSPDRRDAFLTTLFGIYGQQPYLVHALEDVEWTLRGIVARSSVAWRPDAYNWVGFAVHPTASPTFAQFFGPSRAHRNGPIYRLIEGVWRQVVDPASTPMRPYEAFWIYCDGGSDYLGPLDVRTRLRQGLILSEQVESLVLRNRADHPLAPMIEHLVADGEGVPLSIVVHSLSDGERPTGWAQIPGSVSGWIQPLPPLEAGDATAVPFGARRQEMTERSGTSLLRVTSDLGTESWIPVIAIREEEETP